jgi:hypothetical protein
MSTSPTSPAARPWHQALAYAVTGQRIEAFGLQAGPEVSRLAAELQRRQAAGEVRLLNVPVTVPDDLMAGLGAAQYRAALAGLRRTLGTEPAGGGVVVTGRTLTPEEQRLEADRPPHHG